EVAAPLVRGEGCERRLLGRREYTTGQSIGKHFPIGTLDVDADADRRPARVPDADQRNVAGVRNVEIETAVFLCELGTSTRTAHDRDVRGRHAQRPAQDPTQRSAAG